MFARTGRLLLRPCWPEDSKAIYHAINDAAIISKLAGAPRPYRLKDAEAFTALANDARYPSLLLFKRTAGEPVLVGCCSLSRHAGQARISYWIARPFWGLGYATEAAAAVLDIARALGHRRVSAIYSADNPAAGNVLQKLGFRQMEAASDLYGTGRRASSPGISMELELHENQARNNSSPNIASFTPYDADSRQEAA